MPPRRTQAPPKNLKVLLGSNGLAWEDHDQVLPRRAQDVAVRQGLHELLGLAAPLRPVVVQAEMAAVFELATRLIIEKRGRGQEINEVDFVREVWAGHRLYLHVGDYNFALLFAALLRARSDYHEGKFQKPPQPPLLGMAIDTFTDAHGGSFGAEILSFYIDTGVMDADNEGGEQATAHRAFTFAQPHHFAEASSSRQAAPLSSSFAGASTSQHVPAWRAMPMSAPGPAAAFAESPEYDSDEFAGVAASDDEDEEEDGAMEGVAAGVEAMVLDEDGDVGMEG